MPLKHTALSPMLIFVVVITNMPITLISLYIGRRLLVKLQLHESFIFCNQYIYVCIYICMSIALHKKYSKHTVLQCTCVDVSRGHHNPQTREGVN